MSGVESPSALGLQRLDLSSPGTQGGASVAYDPKCRAVSFDHPMTGCVPEAEPPVAYRGARAASLGTSGRDELFEPENEQDFELDEVAGVAKRLRLESGEPQPRPSPGTIATRRSSTGMGRSVDASIEEAPLGLCDGAGLGGGLVEEGAGSGSRMGEDDVVEASDSEAEGAADPAAVAIAAHRARSRSHCRSRLRGRTLRLDTFDSEDGVGFPVEPPVTAPPTSNSSAWQPSWGMHSTSASGQQVATDAMSVSTDDGSVAHELESMGGHGHGDEDPGCVVGVGGRGVGGRGAGGRGGGFAQAVSGSQSVTAVDAATLAPPPPPPPSAAVLRSASALPCTRLRFGGEADDAAGAGAASMGPSEAEGLELSQVVPVTGGARLSASATQASWHEDAVDASGASVGSASTAVVQSQPAGTSVCPDTCRGVDDGLVRPTPVDGIAVGSRCGGGGGCSDFAASTSSDGAAAKVDPSEVHDPLHWREDRETILPTMSGCAHEGGDMVSPQTVKRLLAGEFRHKYTRYFIIDCRFAFEYDGGHIRSAINLYTPDAVRSLLFSRPPAHGEVVLVLFHCEFSKNRAPKMYSFVRSCDRNMNQWPRLHYPHMYIIHKGYKNVFHTVPDVCKPRTYRPMLSAGFQLERKECQSRMRDAYSRCGGKRGRKCSGRLTAAPAAPMALTRALSAAMPRFSPASALGPDTPRAVVGAVGRAGRLNGVQGGVGGGTLLARMSSADDAEERPVPVRPARLRMCVSNASANGGVGARAQLFQSEGFRRAGAGAGAEGCGRELRRTEATACGGVRRPSASTLAAVMSAAGEGPVADRAPPSQQEPASGASGQWHWEVLERANGAEDRGRMDEEEEIGGSAAEDNDEEGDEEEEEEGEGKVAERARSVRSRLGARQLRFARLSRPGSSTDDYRMADARRQLAPLDTGLPLTRMTSLPAHSARASASASAAAGWGQRRRPVKLPRGAVAARLGEVDRAGSRASGRDSATPLAAQLAATGLGTHNGRGSRVSRRAASASAAASEAEASVGMMVEEEEEQEQEQEQEQDEVVAGRLVGAQRGGPRVAQRGRVARRRLRSEPAEMLHRAPLATAESDEGAGGDEFDVTLDPPLPPSARGGSRLDELSALSASPPAEEALAPGRTVSGGAAMGLMPAGAGAGAGAGGVAGGGVAGAQFMVGMQPLSPPSRPSRTLTEPSPASAMGGPLSRGRSFLDALNMAAEADEK